jgi:hypothetical protein
LHLLVDTEFDGAYGSLRAANILGRVEGFNGERWSMHRLVADFARRRVGRLDRLTHAAAFAGWLREPTLPLEPEIPHIISAVMELARSGLSPDREELDLYYRRSLIRGWRDLRHLTGETLLRALADESNGPQAIGLIFEGIADANEDVRAQAVDLVNRLGPTPDALLAIERTLDDPSKVVRQRAVLALLKGREWSRERLLDEALRMSDRAFGTLVDVLVTTRDRPGIRRLSKSRRKATEEQLVEIEVARALLGSSRAAGPLFKALAKEPPGSRFARIRDALGYLLADDRRLPLKALVDATQNSVSDEVALYAATELARRGKREGAVQIVRLASASSAFGIASPHVAARALVGVAPDLLPELAPSLDPQVLDSTLARMPSGDLGPAAASWDDRAPELAAGARRVLGERAAEEAAKSKAAAEREAERRAAEERRNAARKGSVGAAASGTSKAGDWSRWAEAERLAAERTAQGTSTESPSQAWRRVWLAEVNAGHDLGSAKVAAKQARDKAAAELAQPTTSD